MTTDASRRNKANKRKGAQMETDVREYLRELGFDTEPLKLSGTQDEGDLVVRLGKRYIVIEAKNEQTIRLGTYLNEATVEAGNFAVHRRLSADQVHPVAIVKARGSGVAESYAVMRLSEYTRLLEAVDS